MTLLMLMPGMDGTGDLFAPLIHALGPSQPVQVVRYPVDRAWGYAELQRCAREQLPAQEPFVLLGESFSGPMAWRLAASAGPRLRGLVLCCTFLSHPMALLGPLADWASRWPLHHVPRGLINRYFLGPDADVATQALLHTTLARVAPQALRARMQAVLRLKPPHDSLPPDLPVLCLRAAQDWIVPRCASRPLARRLPRAQQVELQGPHGLLQAQPAASAKVIAEFMQRLGRGDGRTDTGQGKVR
jgi:pimeloyl-ACP methyl ester carboxylesterase